MGPDRTSGLPPEACDKFRRPSPLAREEFRSQLLEEAIRKPVGVSPARAGSIAQEASGANALMGSGASRNRIVCDCGPRNC